MIAVREFKSGAEVIAHAAAVRARIRGLKPPAKRAEQPHSQVAETARHALPLWKTEAILFDDHVTTHRTGMVIQKMIDAGEIEYVMAGRRSVPLIVREVLEHYPEFSIADLKGASRSRKLVEARHLAYYEVKVQRPDMSFPAIGKWFGGRDHTTILHGFNKIAKMKGEA